MSILRAQHDSDRASVKSRTERLIYELGGGNSLATLSDSQAASAPVHKEVVRKRKPRSPKSAAHQAEYHKQWRKTKRGLASLTAASKRWQEKYPERLAAQRQVASAIRRGRLVRGSCELAGPDCKGRIEAHHDDYSKPMEVRWACRRHHEQLDRERRSPDSAALREINARVGDGAELEQRSVLHPGSGV